MNKLDKFSNIVFFLYFISVSLLLIIFTAMGLLSSL